MKAAEATTAAAAENAARLTNASRVAVARSLASRMRGLMLRRDLPRGEALLIERCPAIHTFFMRFPIDALFLDGAGNPVRLVRDIAPWRAWVCGGKKARAVLEARAGWLEVREPV